MKRLFKGWRKNIRDEWRVKIGYDNALAHKIEAGADIFLMPSRYEPCGLNQIYSLRYGTVPVVRATGGLDDTIQNFDTKTHQGTGFKFEDYDGPCAYWRRSRGFESVFANPKVWQHLAEERHGQGFFVEGFCRRICHTV